MGKSLQKKLTKAQLAEIQLYLLKNYTIKEIADVYNVSVTKISRYLNWEKNTSKRTIHITLGNKIIPYCKNEFDYGKIPKYNLTEILDEEKSIKMSKSKGLGDDVAKLTAKLRIDKLAKRAAEIIGADGCGCEKKKDILNEWIPYKKESKK